MLTIHILKANLRNSKVFKNSQLHFWKKKKKIPKNSLHTKHRARKTSLETCQFVTIKTMIKRTRTIFVFPLTPTFRCHYQNQLYKRKVLTCLNLNEYCTIACPPVLGFSHWITYLNGSLPSGSDLICIGNGCSENKNQTNIKCKILQASHT